MFSFFGVGSPAGPTGSSGPRERTASSISEIAEFKVASARPDPPSNVPHLCYQQRLSWDPVAGADGYLVDVGEPCFEQLERKTSVVLVDPALPPRTWRDMAVPPEVHTACAATALIELLDTKTADEGRVFHFYLQPVKLHAASGVLRVAEKGARLKFGPYHQPTALSLLSGVHADLEAPLAELAAGTASLRKLLLGDLPFAADAAPASVAATSLPATVASAPVAPAAAPEAATALPATVASAPVAPAAAPEASPHALHSCSQPTVEAALLLHVRRALADLHSLEAADLRSLAAAHKHHTFRGAGSSLAGAVAVELAPVRTPTLTPDVACAQAVAAAPPFPHLTLAAAPSVLLDTLRENLSRLSAAVSAQERAVASLLVPLLITPANAHSLPEGRAPVAEAPCEPASLDLAALGDSLAALAARITEQTRTFELMAGEHQRERLSHDAALAAARTEAAAEVAAAAAAERTHAAELERIRGELNSAHALAAQAAAAAAAAAAYEAEQERARLLKKAREELDASHAATADAVRAAVVASEAQHKREARELVALVERAAASQHASELDILRSQHERDLRALHDRIAEVEADNSLLKARACELALEHAAAATSTGATASQLPRTLVPPNDDLARFDALAAALHHLKDLKGEDAAAALRALPCPCAVCVADADADDATAAAIVNMLAAETSAAATADTCTGLDDGSASVAAEAAPNVTTSTSRPAPASPVVDATIGAGTVVPGRSEAPRSPSPLLAPAAETALDAAARELFERCVPADRVDLALVLWAACGGADSEFPPQVIAAAATDASNTRPDEAFHRIHVGTYGSGTAAAPGGSGAPPPPAQRSSLLSVLGLPVPRNA